MTTEISFCVFTTTAAGADDLSPCRMVSEEQLLHYKAAEAELAALKSTATVRGIMALRRALARLRIYF